MSRRDWRLVWALVVAFLGSGCHDPLTAQAQRILIRTVPTDAGAPALPEPTRYDQSANFSWDFDTAMNASVYVDWVKRQLRDFEVVDSRDQDLRFAALIGGDAYHLRVSPQAGAGRTHVHVELMTSAD